ncbi:retinoblastoma-like protein 1 isoform X1 [Amphibalanus amphitrite]|uniref:retinoblastoma-like protein 1 isoform X1 n=1 Tax=Amphibalanus amphitrite TaxID=1232801 RepID=UPI001C916B45|nr:retinoblastoma-like protein 1 isoform X1 [Amphibalanus amphitrite]
MPLPTPHPVLSTANMNAVDEKSDQVHGQFTEMCYDLNMDKMTAREAWNSYCQVKQNYTLEGNKLHWLACSLYVSCRKGSVPSVGGHQAAPMQGNFISLTRLLRFSKFSLLEFFDKSKKWAEMCNLPQPFHRNLDALERNFAVSTFLFNNYFEPMFKSIYTDPADDPPRPPKSRKQRRSACTASDLFQFTWSLFVLVKSTIPSVSSDLVSTYHLLLACVDYMFGVTVAADRRDLLNRQSPALPANFNSRDYEPPAVVPSILEYLCNQFDGLIVEAKAIRQHVWKDKIAQLFSSNALWGDASTLHGILSLETFDANWKSVNKRYEEYLLTCGNFDERTFLGEQACQEIGTPSKANNYSVTAGDLAERMHVRRSLMLSQGAQSQSVLMPATPLTGRSYLRPVDAAPSHPAATPITASMYSVSRLQALLDGRGPQPSAQLAALLSGCTPDPTETIATLVSEFRSEFAAACARTMAEDEAVELVERRFSMAATFYYKMLENVVTSERQKKPDVNLLVLLEQTVFHRCLLACSLEIVLFSYSTATLEFPWLIEALGIEPYDFYKLLEIIIREEQGLCRDVVKHLNKVEELVLDSMAWRRCSRLWAVIDAASGNIPSSETVAPHLQEATERTPTVGGGPASVLMSPIPAVRRVFVTYSRPSPRNPQQSPLSSATDRFMSPVTPSTARRRLFVGPRAAGGQHRVIAEGSAGRGQGTGMPLRTYSLFVGSRGGEGRYAAPVTDGERTVRPVGAPAAGSPAPAVVKTPSARTDAAAPAAADSQPAVKTDGAGDGVQNRPLKTEAGGGSGIFSEVAGSGIFSDVADAGPATSETETAVGAAPEPAAAQTPPQKPLVTVSTATPTAAPSATPSAATPGGDGSTPPVKPHKQNSLGLFFRKFYYLAAVRMRDLCERLKLLDDVRETIWTVFEYVIVHHVTVMQGRHLDQLIMSSIFIVCKAFGINKKFTDIMGMYRCQPQAKSHVYRSVLLGVVQRPADGAHKEQKEKEDKEKEKEKEKEKDGQKEEKEQRETPADSAPIKAPPAGAPCPPTPSRMAGTATSYQFEDRHEERGDIIQFYNQVFVEKVKAFVSKFSKGDGKPPLSPLPSPRNSPLPRSRRVSSAHSIYISPLKQSPMRLGDRAATMRSYSFNRSPAHELRSINAMVKPSAEKRALAAGARLRSALQPTEDGEPEPKRYMARLRGVLDQRQANATE